MADARRADGASELERAYAAVETAMQAGATQAEATLTVGERFTAEARDHTLTKVERSTGKMLQLRIFVDGRKSSLTSSDFDSRRLRAAIERAVAQARYVQSDPLAGLPDRLETPPAYRGDLNLFASAVAERTAQQKTEEAVALERRIREIDARIDNSNGSSVGDAVATVAFVNSLGLNGWYRSTQVNRSSSPVAHDAGNKRTGAYGTAARSLDDLETVEAVARGAVRRTVELFGARKPPTMRVPVIFERDVAASVVADLFAALNAANVATGNSWLVDRVGERIGSDLVRIVDDGCLPGRLGSSPFDGEGVPTRRTVAVDRGVLRTFLYDTYHARKLGARTTANSAGGGIGPNNFYLEAGAGSLEDLIAATPRGVLVLDTIGFAAEHASGTYSRGARGFYVENGEMAYPIDGFTIAGTFAQMLAGVDRVAGDLRFDASVVSPSFRVAEMTISGT